MFSVSFPKFVRTRFIQRTAGTWGVHKRRLPCEGFEQFVPNSCFNRYREKTTIPAATNTEKTYFSLLWVGAMDLKVKGFCVLDTKPSKNKQKTQNSQRHKIL